MERGVKTIGVLTFHDSDNFGSVLQAYATCRVLAQEGFAPQLIDLRKPEVGEIYRILPRVTSKTALAAAAYNSLHYGSLEKRKNRFERFRMEQLPLSPKTYTCGEELLEQNPGCDGYIVGSDQVWNTDILDFDEAYLLSFAPNARKMAYAASFGPVRKIGQLPENMVQALKNFDKITVRERMAADMVEEMGLSRPQVVPDPVFLLTKEQWNQAAKPVHRKKPYMLCYFPGVVTPEFEAYTCRLAKEKGFLRVILMPHWRNFFRSGQNAYDAGPAEFMGLVGGASMICTNSFHATAFAVLYNKDFLVGTQAPRSDERINTLLDACALADREWQPDSEPAGTPDFTQANRLMEGWVRTGLRPILEY